MELGDVIESGFRLWLSNLKVGLFFLFSHLSTVLILLIPFGILWKECNGNFFIAEQVFKSNPALIASFFISFILASLVSIYFYFAGIRACVMAIDGELSIIGAMKYALKRFLSYIGAEILKILVILISLTPALFLFIILFATPNSFSKEPNFLISGVIFVVLSVITFIIILIFLVYVEYAVADGHGAVESIKVSFRTAKNCFFETIILLILFFAIGVLCSLLARLIAFPFMPSFMQNPFMFNSTRPNSFLFPSYLLDIVKFSLVYLASLSLLNSFVVSPLRAFMLILNMRKCS